MCRYGIDYPRSRLCWARAQALTGDAARAESLYRERRVDVDRCREDDQNTAKYRGTGFADSRHASGVLELVREDHVDDLQADFAGDISMHDSGESVGEVADFQALVDE